MICVDNASLYSDCSVNSKRNSIDIYSIKSQTRLINPARLSIATLSNSVISADGINLIKSNSCPTSPTITIFNHSNLQSHRNSFIIDSEQLYACDDDLPKLGLKDRIFRYTTLSAKMPHRYQNLSHGSMNSYRSTQCLINQRCFQPPSPLSTTAFLFDRNNFHSDHHSGLNLDEEDQIKKLEVILARIQNISNKSSLNEQRFISRGVYTKPYSFENRQSLKPQYIIRKSNSANAQRKDKKELEGLMDGLIRGDKMTMATQKFIPRTSI